MSTDETKKETIVSSTAGAASAARAGEGAQMQGNDEHPEPIASTDEPVRVKGRTMVLVALLWMGATFALLVGGSVLVVYTTGLVGRWLGLPQLPLMLAFLGLLALLVIGWVGIDISSKVAETGMKMARAMEREGDKIVEGINDSTGEIVDMISELPAVVVEPRPQPRGRSIVIEAPGGDGGRRKPSRRR
jgi:hypothetical protein